MQNPFSRALAFPDPAPWKAARRPVMTGSDAAAALGFSSRTTPLQVWNAKRNGAEIEETVAMRRGRALEPLVLALFAESADALPVLTVPPTPWTLVPHPAMPFLAATPDAITHTPDFSSAAVVEAKTMYGRFAEVENGECPIGWQIQVAITAACCELESGWIQALVNDAEYRWRVEVNPEQMAVIAESLRDFMRCVETGDMPPHTASAADRKILYEAFADSSETAILFSRATSEKARRWKDLGEMTTAIKKERDQLTADLLREVGQHTYGILDDGTQRIKVSRVAASPRVYVPFRHVAELESAGIPYKLEREEGHARANLGKYNPKKEPAPIALDTHTAQV